MDNHQAIATEAVAAMASVDVFGLVQAILRAAADPKACEIAAAELKRQSDSVAADRRQLEAEKAAFAEHEKATHAALAKQADANAEEAGQLHLRSLELKNQHATLAGIFRDISIKDEQLRRRMLRYSGQEINEKLQHIPEWPELERMFGAEQENADPRAAAAKRFLEGKVADSRASKPKGAHAHA